MYPEAINQKTQCVFHKIKQTKFIADFYLAGGTALAIYLGHRESIDLDFFSQKEFSLARIKKELSTLGSFTLISEEEGTLHGLLDEVKLSFFCYPYPMLFPFVNFEKVSLADERDIASMKIDAISSRGSKKDFVDLYFLLEKYSLEELLSFFEKKYSQIKFNRLHILKSLIFFNDAQIEPDPIMLKNISWDKIRNGIEKNVERMV
ncbi:MAG: nucleotidyl transferase AbiEii/AbiGii toxin family protein [Parcubacteria group bacterium]|jgi:predicted nucleotidyltransferase component of viral defense system